MKELNLIIQDFEETCSTLAITHDIPCEEMIKEKFEEYHQAKIKLLGIGIVSNSFYEGMKVEDCEYYCSDECDCVGKHCCYGK